MPQASTPPATTDEVIRLEKQAQIDLQNQKPESAIIAYKRILVLDPKNAGAHSNLGLAYYLHGEFASAIDEFNIALRAMPDRWNIVALCGISEANTGRNTEAIAHLDQSFQHVEDPGLRLAAGKRLFSILYEAGELDRAAAVVRKLQELDSKNLDVIYAAHQVYSILASRSFLAMAQLAPDSARMYQLRADRMAQMGNRKGAIAAYRLAIERDPHLSGVHFALAEVLSVSQNEAERAQAEDEYLNALADNPEDEKSECRLGDIHIQRSDLVGATEHYQRALMLQPDDPDANEGYGMVLLASDSPRKARTFLKRATQFDPTNVAAYYHLSQASRKAGDLDAANREMAEFLKLKADRENLKRSFDDLPIQAAREAALQNDQRGVEVVPK